MFDSRKPRIKMSNVRAKGSTLFVATGLATAMGLSLVGTASADTKATVTLTVNGDTSTVTTDAPKVADLLTQQNVTYDGNDILSPGPNTNISDGLDVDVTSAVRVTVTEESGQFSRIVTAQTVSGARKQLGLPDGSRKASKVLTGYAFQRSPFFAPNGRKLTGKDSVREGSRAIVRNIKMQFSRNDVHVNHRTVKDRTHLLRSGSSRVYKKGHDGRKHVVYRKRFVDGQLTSRSVVKSHWTKKPQRRVVRFGTGPNWNALANCESGGNPNAVNPSGFYGLYQFSLSTWHAVGGKGSPTDYGYWEQTKRAWILFKGSGRAPWPVCGRNL